MDSKSSPSTGYTSRCSSSILRDQKPARTWQSGSGFPIPSFWVSHRVLSAPSLPNCASQIFIQIRYHMGYERMRLRELRHFAATSLIAVGIPVRTVSGRFGHANLSNTLMVKSNFVVVNDQETARFMGKLVPHDKSNAVTFPQSTSRSRAPLDSLQLLEHN